jgi:hypothetical protein
MGYTIEKANSILNADFKNTYYIGLSTTVPNDAGGNFTEPLASAGYKRPKLAVKSASNKQVQNYEIMYFGEATSDWGTILYFGIFTSETEKVPHYFGKIDKEGGVTVLKDQVGLVRANELKIGLDKDSLD